MGNLILRKFKCLFRLYRYSGISDVKMRNRQRRLTSARDRGEGQGEGRQGNRWRETEGRDMGRPGRGKTEDGERQGRG